MQIYTYPSEAATEKIQAIVDRSTVFGEQMVENVQNILDQVKHRGDEALLEYTRRFDSPDFREDSIAVTEAEFESARKKVDPLFLQSLNRAAAQIESFHRKQLRKSWVDMERPGTFLGQIFNPVDGAGIYVPGGQGGSTPLVSSVLMGAIPAKIAGVRKIVMVTPPDKDGNVHPCMLAAAERVGVDAVYKIGSAWAIGALAYGTRTVPRCDVIVGPGNVYVTIAKKLVSGTVGIDMIAGPSEVLVIADETAKPEFAAADLLSQAEHDAMASAVLITDSPSMAQAVQKAVEKQLEELHRRDIARMSLDQFGAILVVPNLDTALELANRIAPEHLELQIADPFAWLGKIRNAGAVFLGNYTPEPVGDYIAGPNHVLPTAGTARFSSALSVDNFIKKTSVLHYSESAFRNEAEDIIRLADVEGLGAHSRSVKVRISS